jgi:hypothetical protein
MHRRAQHRHIGSGNGALRAVFQARDPGNDQPETKTQDELAGHGDPAALADDESHHGRRTFATRHEVDQRDGSVLGLKSRFEDQRVGAVTAMHAHILVARRDLPASMFARSQERGEAGVGVEARPAQPIDRTVAPDQRGRFTIADESIIFDAAAHRVTTRNQWRL